MGTFWSERGYFGILGNDNILIFYPIISYQRINVHCVNTVDMGILLWHIGVSGI